MHRFTVALLAPFAIATSVWAGYDEGEAAYKRGDCTGAVREVASLAQAGDAKARSLMLKYAWFCDHFESPPGIREFMIWQSIKDREEVESGHADAEARLRVEYHETICLPPDDAVFAERWLRPLAEADDADAQFFLACLQVLYPGRARDYSEPAGLLRKAAPVKSWAAYLLAVRYREGLGVAADMRAALEWFASAAERRYRSAQAEVERAYLQGDGVPRDVAAALKWLATAAERGHGVAQNYLGIMYRDGIGVQQDLVQAYKWFTLAKVNSSSKSVMSEARENWVEVSRKMAPKQIEEAEDLAKRFVAK